MRLAKDKKTDTSLKLPQIRNKLHIHAHTQRKKKQKNVISPFNHKYFISSNKRYDMQKDIRKKQQSSHQKPSQNLLLSKQYKPVAFKKYLKPNKNQQFRESKLLLLKDLEDSKKKKKLCFLVEYNQNEDEKEPLIKNFYRKTLAKSFWKPQHTEMREHKVQCQYQNSNRIPQIDFLKLFILEQLLFYLSHSNNRSKQQMHGFCKIYLENTQKSVFTEMLNIFKKKKDVQQSIIFEKLSLYVILLLSTDTVNDKNIDMLLKSLASCIHKNNLILLDLLVKIGEFQNHHITSEFHIFNTMRFNQSRRKLIYDQDGIQLVKKNNIIISNLLKSLLQNCTFDSLKGFIEEIMLSKSDFDQRYEQVIFVIQSLEEIMQKSVKIQEIEIPKPPFLPPAKKQYTLVLDLDQTLIHYKQTQITNSFLVRPFCYQFLREMAKYYQIVIFTASVKQYADTILDIIDKQKCISHRLYRQHTRLQDYVSIKDLSMLGRDLAKTIIIDNIPSNFKLQPKNGIYIITWTGDEQDCCLLNLIPILQTLVKKKSSDVRLSLQKISKFMQEAIKKNEQVDLELIQLN